LDGERKHVTVLFADLKGSTELIDGVDPEEARTLLDGAVQVMMEAVHRFEGTVNHILGDGIMALFGAPIAHEDHAIRACYAALALQEGLEKYADEARGSAGGPLEGRVGLNSGEVVVRDINNDLRTDYSAIGEAVHLASRMEQLAKPGAINLTAQTLRLAEGFVKCRSLGPTAVKGISEPVEVFELLGTEAVRTRLQAAAARGLTRFVGRRTEMDAIQRAFQQAGAGHGQVVALVGEPGVGKSRLVWEVTHSPLTQGWQIIESGSLSYGKATSYLPVIDLLKGYFGLGAYDDDRDIQRKISSKLADLDADLESAAPAFLWLLSVPVEDPGWQTLEPPQRRRRTLDAIKRLLLCEANSQRLVLVFEDLHWIDAETQALLDSLVESVPAAPILLLVNYRPEYQHAWANKTYYTQIRVDPLSAESADELLNAVVGTDPSVQPIKQMLIERTDGNPLFLEESVRTLVETGTLVGERGANRVGGSLAEVELPATVHAMLAARVDRLPAQEKRLLQAAAVVGKDVPIALLEAVADVSGEALQEQLLHLQRAEFLAERSLFPELEYTFRHALTHEVAYGNLLRTRRRQLHAQLVEVMESQFRERLSEHVERLAHHSLRGELWEKAATYLRQAGQQAIWRMAHRQAIDYFEQALAALGHLEQTAATLNEAVDVRLELHTVLRQLGEYDHAREHLARAEHDADASGDRVRIGFVYTYLAKHLWSMVDHRQGVVVGQRAVAIARETGDAKMHFLASQVVGQALMDLGDYAAAEAVLVPAADALHGELEHERLGQPILAAVLVRQPLVWSFGFRGDFANAIRHIEAGLRVAEATGHPGSIAAACMTGGAIGLRGDTVSAIELLERGLELCRQNQMMAALAVTGCFLGLAYTLAGRPTAAIESLENGLALAERIKIQPCVSLWTGWLAAAYLKDARIGDAARTAARALETARARHERGYEAMALRQLGEICAHSGSPNPERSEKHYREALVIAEELGMRPLQAHCHLGLGSLCRETGRADQAHAELTEADKLYRGMDMVFWLPEVETELAQIV
jgi:class 3 adenylate cyclase/tetratricopeptide (TPR) repeat protein